MRVMERISYLVVVVSSDIKWEIGGVMKVLALKNAKAPKNTLEGRCSLRLGFISLEPLRKT
jgi:hypothetical protein